MSTIADRKRGCLIGLAVGDALGSTVEFQPPGSFPPVTNYRAGGPHGLAPGEWTDDTSLALALADSIGQRGWDLNDEWEPLTRMRDIEPLHPELDVVANGSFRELQPPDIQGSGYVVKSLEAALWAFHDANDFAEAVLRAVNLGDDADTIGAVCGQLAGAYWGELGIPEKWREGLARMEMLEDAMAILMNESR